MKSCRFFVDAPAGGAWNMAVDEVLLEQAADEGLASLRFYYWKEPTLSLGYFQNYAEREQHSASRHAAAVRRLSGGGALLHDRELTYSLSLPANHPLARRSTELYFAVHDAAIETLAECGVTASMHRDRAPFAPVTPLEKPFLCFARRTDADVVFPLAGGADAKILGSAQRRRRGAVLQHGALLLGSSSCAPELPGLAELTTSYVDPQLTIDAWSRRLAARLDLQLNRTDSLVAASCQRCNDLAKKFAWSTWLRRR